MSRVLVVSLNFAPEVTGIGRYNSEMASWLVERGHDVHVVTAPPYYPAWRVEAGNMPFLLSREERGGVRIYRVPIYVPHVPSGVRRLLHLISFAATSAPVILAQAFSWRPELILMTEPTLAAAPAVLLAAHLFNARTLLHVQDFEIDAAFELGIVRSARTRRVATQIERRLTAGFSHVSTISPRMLERLAEKGVDPACTLLLPNWADIDRIRPDVDGTLVRRRLNLDAKTVLALYSGNIGRKQGIGTLIEAARLLDGDPDIRLVICGDGAGRPDIEQYAAGMPNVTFLPLQPEAALPALLAAADIHLLPQRANAADLVMPSKLGNMLASGRPVIAGANPGTQLFEAIQDCGIAVPPEDAEALANALRQLSANPECRQALGQAARQRAEDEWGQETIMLKLEEYIWKSESSADDRSQQHSNRARKPRNVL